MIFVNGAPGINITSYSYTSSTNIDPWGELTQQHYVVSLCDESHTLTENMAKIKLELVCPIRMWMAEIFVKNFHPSAF